MPWYDYSPTESGLKPVVSLHLMYGDRHIEMFALVDSGADWSLLSIGYANILGLDRKDAIQERALVAGGGAITVYTWPDAPLQLRFEAHRIPFTGGFIEFANQEDTNLLGRDDFFQRFIVQFWDAQHVMNIDISPDFPRRAAIPR